MPRITVKEAGHPNVLAFMDAITQCELTDMITPETDYGYRVLVGSTPKKLLLMRDYNDHPNILNKALNSTAAGAYQILYKYWPHYKKVLGLPDFSPRSQDLYVLQILKEEGAIPHLRAGRFESAVMSVSNIWASLPGAGYGQHEHKLEFVLAAYEKAGGTLA